MTGVIRVPGSKKQHLSVLRPFLDPLINQTSTFVDLFVGGGSVLLDVAERYPDIPLVANDADEGIAALWKVVGGAEPGVTALESMLDVRPTRALWERLRAKVPEDPVEAAFAVIFLSRTSFGGSLVARAMKDIGSRYNPQGIRRQIRRARDLLYGRLVVSSMDAVAWLDEHRADQGAVLFVDPPYVAEGNDLYRVGMSPREHAALRDRLRDRDNWVLTYRDHPTVRHLYRDWCDIHDSPKGRGEVVVLPAGAPGQVPAEGFSDSHDLAEDHSVSEVVMAQNTHRPIGVGPSGSEDYNRQVHHGSKESTRSKDLSIRRAWSIDELPNLYPYSESTFRNFIDDKILRCHHPGGNRKACVFTADLEEFEARVRGTTENNNGS
ncbi:MAG: DNA adenine methylase [Planctomycetota bacterium]